MDATEMISEGKLSAIVVAIGYRLNIFGFLTGDVLETESGQSGNYRLWDQRLAIEWVYKNISHFGGDINNITLGGRSAGAYSVQAQTIFHLLNTDDSTPMPFHRLFMNSNAIST